MSEPQEPSEQSDKKKSLFRKSWQAYLFELVVLSLAVFLGFLADNFREGISESQQAKELAQSYYDELLTDSVTLQRAIMLRYQKDTALYELKNYVLYGNLENVSKDYTKNYILAIQSTSRFQPTDVILEQLKYSGSLRYFKSKELQLLTGNLSTIIGLVRQRNDLEINVALEYLIPFVISSNDQEYFGKLSQGGSLPFTELSNSEVLKLIENDSITVSYRINNLANFKRKDVYNMLWQYRSIFNGTTYTYLRYQKLNQELLGVLRREYEIK